jgi:hypothetical protein
VAAAATATTAAVIACTTASSRHHRHVAVVRACSSRCQPFCSHHLCSVVIPLLGHCSALWCAACVAQPGLDTDCEVRTHHSVKAEPAGGSSIAQYSTVQHMKKSAGFMSMEREREKSGVILSASVLLT